MKNVILVVHLQSRWTSIFQGATQRMGRKFELICRVRIIHGSIVATIDGASERHSYVAITLQSEVTILVGYIHHIYLTVWYD